MFFIPTGGVSDFLDCNCVVLFPLIGIICFTGVIVFLDYDCVVPFHHILLLTVLFGVGLFI